MKVLRCMLSVVWVMSVFTPGAFAHHSTSLFDGETVTTVEGQVTRVAWLSPHIFILVETTEPDGEVVEWRFESVSIPIMVREGWLEDSLREGERVTVEGYRVRNSNARYGWLRRVVKEDGTILSPGLTGRPPVTREARGDTRGSDDPEN